MCSAVDKNVITAGKDDFLKEWRSRFLVKKNEKKQKKQNKQKKKGKEDEGGATMATTRGRKATTRGSG
jgi:hypothetical protein